MIKSYDMEQMAGMSIDQIDAMAVGGEVPEGEEETIEATEETEGEQVVEESAATGATEEEGQGGVAMKGGKGTIPYAVLKDTREELAETKRRLEALESKSYQAVIPENHAEMVEQAKTSYQELAKQFEEGDLEWEDYQAKLIEMTAQNENLLAARIKSEISTEMRAQMAEQSAKDATDSWQSTVDQFLASKPDAIDYSADQEKFAELDAAVKMFANNPANAKRDHQWFLAKAHKEVMENNGITPKATAKPKAAQEADDEGKSPIYSLSDIPGGLVPDGGSESEQIASLSGAALTNRFLNDPSQIDKMLAGLR